MNKIRKFQDFNEFRQEMLKNDPELTIAYLNQALEDGDKKYFLIALKNVIEAQDDVAEFAEKTNLSQQRIYEMLSEGGNLTLGELIAISKAMGLKIQIIPA